MRLSQSFFAIIFLSFNSFAQSGFSGALWSARSKQYGVFAQVHSDTTFVFRLSGIIDVAGTGSRLVFLDTLIKNSGNSSVYTGKNSKLEFSGDRLKLILSDSPFFRGKRSNQSQTLQLTRVSNQEDKRIDINNGYWWHRFLEMHDDFKKDYPWFAFSWREGFHEWKRIWFKSAPFQEFVHYVEERLGKFEDSIAHEEKTSTSITRNIMSGIATVDFETVKTALTQLPSSSHQRYIPQIVAAICDYRPELFFPLAEALPKKKQDMFAAAYWNKKHRKTLERIETDSPVKKEFMAKGKE